MLLQMAWRNLLRNGRRTLLTLSALALGVCAIVTGGSYNESIWSKTILQITESQVGHLQIHGAGWQAEPELGNVVADPAAVEARVAKALPGARLAQRVLGYGLAGTEAQSAAVLVMGIQPEREPSGSGPLTIVRGRALSTGTAGEVVLGRALAEQLEVQPGSELVLLGQAVDGSTANDRYTVVGLADAGSDELDATAVFLNLADAQAFFGLEGGVHQMLVRLLAEEQDVSSHLEALHGALDLAKLEGLSWDQMLPELKTVIEQKRQGQYGIAAIVFLIVALGVFNAMTMSTFERTREFGVMASLGTRRSGIRRLVVTEALLLGLVGLAVGVALAAGLTAAIGTVELGMMKGDMIGIRMPSVFTLRLYPQAILNATVTVLLTVVAGGLWPAWRASRLEPVEATRYV